MAAGLLISFAGFPVMASSLFPDNGLASLAGALREGGHGVRVLDYNTLDWLQRLAPGERTAQLVELLPALAGSPSDDHLRRLLAISRLMEGDLERTTALLLEDISLQVEAVGADFVGFKLWSGDGFLASVMLAEGLRGRFPGLHLYAGGPAVLYSEDAVFSFSDAFEALVDGEGEEAILGLAAHAAGEGDLERVPNLILRRGDQLVRTRRSLVADLDGLPMPAYDPEVYPGLAEGQNQHIKLFVLDESRGCPMGCAFCIHQEASGARWRVKSVGRVMAELQQLRRLYGVRAFRLGGSYTPPGFYQDLGRALSRLESRDAFQFCGFGHPGGLPGETMAALSRAGLCSLFLGVESFDGRDGELLGKHLAPRRSLATVRRCVGAGVVPVISLIHPVPGQAPDAQEVNCRALEALEDQEAFTVQTQFPGLVPRTSWWNDRQRFGLRLQVPEHEYRRILARYKIRHIVPPVLWEPLPYTVDGRTFTQIAGENAAFQRRLAAGGFSVNISDETVLLARHRGCQPADLHRQLRRLIFTLDSQGLGLLTADLNRELGPRK